MIPQPNQPLPSPPQSFHKKSLSLPFPTPPLPSTPSSLKIYPTPAGTYLLHNNTMQWSRQILHVDQNGKVLGSIQSEFICGDLCVGGKWVLFVEQGEKGVTRVRQWGYWEGEDGEGMGVEYRHQFGNLSTVKVFFYSQTNLFCIIQYLKNSDKKSPMPIQIHYHSIPILQPQPTPIHSFIPLVSPNPTLNQSLKSSYQPIKLNNHSGIAWVYQSFNNYSMSQSCYYLYDLRKVKEMGKEGKEGFQRVRLEYFFNKNLGDFWTFVGLPWEPVFGEIYFEASVRLNTKVASSYASKPKTLQALLAKERSYHFMWNYRENKFRQFKVEGDDNQVQFINGFRPIKLHRIVRDKLTFNHTSTKSSKPMLQKYRQNPISFVDPLTLQTLYTHPSSPKLLYNNTSKYQQSYLHYDPKIYIKTQQEKDYFIIKMLRYRELGWSGKVIGVFMVAEIVGAQRVDQGLLEGVFGMLGDGDGDDGGFGDGWKWVGDEDEQKGEKEEREVEREKEIEVFVQQQKNVCEFIDDQPSSLY